MLQKWERRASLTGAVFAILLVACFIVSGEAPGGETPGVDESAQEVVSFYTENDAEMFIAATLSGLGAGCLLLFVGSLGRVLESAGGAAAGLSAVARAGGVVAAVGVLIFAGLMFTLGERGGQPRFSGHTGAPRPER